MKNDRCVVMVAALGEHHWVVLRMRIDLTIAVESGFLDGMG